MYITHAHKILFIAIPKTGTRSIYASLEKLYGGEILSEHARDIPKEYEDYYSFCVVRNPYDRMCSDYWSRCKRENDRYGFLAKFKEKKLENNLENYITLYKEHPRSKWFEQYNFIKNNTINKILRFETLQQDFNTLPFLDKPFVLPFINTTAKRVYSSKANKYLMPRPSWEKMITPAAGKEINKIFKKDFELLNYEMVDF